MKISEKFIFHIWDAQHLKTNLKTETGKDLQILYVGSWNNASGPDFKDVVIKINNQILRGDVEIHQRVYDWQLHKHHEDPNFNKVILHVVFDNSSNIKYTINEAGDLIEILEVQKFLDQSISKLLEKYDGVPLSIKSDFCEYFAGKTTDITSKLLEKNGIERLHKKIKRFSSELIFTDLDQIAYQGIMEALGYNKNKFQMLQLSREISFEFIKKNKQIGMSKEQLLSIFIFSSSLSDHIPKDFPNEIKYKLISLYSNQSFFSEKINIDWKLFRIRPVNHPVNRIIQIIDFLWEASDSSIFNKLLTLFSFSDNQVDMKEFYLRLNKLFSHSDITFPQQYRLGKTRLDTIAINIIIPLVLLYAEKMSYNNLSEAILNIFRNYCALPKNYIETHMNRFMQQSQKKIIRKKAIHQQGLLNIYYDFCKDHNCQICQVKLEADLAEM
jgi:hypothetical protein